MLVSSTSKNEYCRDISRKKLISVSPMGGQQLQLVKHNTITADH